MRNYIVLALLAIASFTPSFSQQDPASVYDAADTFEETAQELTAAYDQELAMTPEQRILFQKKIEEYLIKAQEIKDNYTGKERINKLYRIHRREVGDMKNILTQIQWRVYDDIRPQLQPLEVTTKE